MIVLGLLLVLVTLLTLGLIAGLDTPAEDGGVGAMVGPTGYAWLDGLLSRVRPWHAVAALSLVGLLTAAVVSGPAEFFLMLFVAALLLLFFRAWRREFLGLMATPDDAFPGRHDKLVWAALMVLLPPVGFWCYRAHRGAAGAKAADPHARPNPTPAADLF